MLNIPKEIQELFTKYKCPICKFKLEIISHSDLYTLARCKSTTYCDYNKVLSTKFHHFDCEEDIICFSKDEFDYQIKIAKELHYVYNEIIITNSQDNNSVFDFEGNIFDLSKFNIKKYVNIINTLITFD